MDKDKCPFCGAETRPGDNFCLNCGNRLLSAAPAGAASQSMGDATLAAPDDWAQSAGIAPVHSAGGWDDEGGATIAASGPEQSYTAAPESPQSENIEHPARFILRADNGDILQEYALDKPEITIGRAPNSDILLSKDKLTSRRHATVRYESGNYVLRDERSANGTFVNGQQVEELVPIELKDSDHVGIGEHELIFHAFGSVAERVEDLPTIAVPYEPQTFGTQDDALRTLASSDEYGTASIESEPQANAQHEDATMIAPEPVPPAAANGFAPSAPPQVPQAPPPVPAIPIPAPVSYTPMPATSTPAAPSAGSSPATAGASKAVPSVSENVPVTTNTSSSSDTTVTFNRLTSLSQPTLPDITALMAALSTLDGQVMSLQEQLNATQEAVHTHDADIAQTANQLRSGVRKVSERMDNTIADVARTREALAWTELLQLMEDVMNNPRDVEYITRLARKARELNKVFQLHQNVLNTMAECNSLLRGMIIEDNR